MTEDSNDAVSNSFLLDDNSRLKLPLRGLVLFRFMSCYEDFLLTVNCSGFGTASPSLLMTFRVPYKRRTF